MMSNISLTDKYTEQLRSEVLKGKWNDPHSFITETQLREYFDVSRVTVRRILANLQAEDILRSVPSKGYVLGPAVLVKNRKKENKKNNQSKKILFVRSPNLFEFQTNSNEHTILEAAQKEVERFGLELEFCQMPLKVLVDKLMNDKNNKVRGVVLEWYEREVAEALLKLGIPTVMVEYAHNEIEMDSVVQDNERGMEQAIDLLWKNGHRKIGLSVWEEKWYQPTQRQKGFVSSLLLRDGLISQFIGKTNRYDKEGGCEIVRQLFTNAKDTPTALIMSNLNMAVGIFDELESLNIQIGKDIDVIGWGTQAMLDNIISGSKWKDFKFPLISWSREEMGRLIIRSIEARYQNPLLPPILVKLPTKLINQKALSKKFKE